MSKYAIWDKESPIITPVGEVYTAEAWKTKYPAAKIDGLKIVCAGGTINGAFFGVFDSMVEFYETAGADFSESESDQDYLDAIEAYEAADHGDGESTPEERIAAALEYNNLLQSPVINPDDPDED